MIFAVLAFATAALMLFFAYALAFARPASLPRCRWAGVALGLPCLAWSAWHACIMLEGGLAKYHCVVWALVPITAVLAFFFLDYLFARASGGFFILAANELIRCAFAYAIVLRPLFSAVCLIVGVLGLFMLGTPWRMRDAMVLAATKRKLGTTFGAVLAFMAIVLVALAAPCIGK